MKSFFPLLSLAVAALCSMASPAAAAEQQTGRPDRFPRRIWAACDFEERRTDVVWTGATETGNIPQYPGNVTACRARRYGDAGTLVVTVKSVSPPRMNAANGVYFRYYCRSVTSLAVELITVDEKRYTTALAPESGAWTETWAEISVDTGNTSGGGAILNEIALIAECEGGAAEPAFIVDDLVCFSNDTSLSEAPDEPFPRRVIGLWQFDVFDDYQPWTKEHYAVVRHEGRPAADLGVARAVKHPRNDNRWIRLIIEPLQAVGACTKLGFWYYQENATMLQIMMFDATVQDNRYIRIADPVRGSWTRATLNFTRDGINNSGTQTPFSPGNRIDDIFFFPGFTSDEKTELFLDEVVLYDAGSCD